MDQQGGKPFPATSMDTISAPLMNIDVFLTGHEEEVEEQAPIDKEGMLTEDLFISCFRFRFRFSTRPHLLQRLISETTADIAFGDHRYSQLHRTPPLSVIRGPDGCVALNSNIVTTSVKSRLIPFKIRKFHVS